MTRKWIAARVTAVTGLLVMWITTGSWDTEESVMAVTVVSAAIIALLVPNAPTTSET